MGTKVTLTSIASGYVGADIDANFDTVADEFDKVVYRDGTSPNQMTASLDMNSNEITNLAAPGNSQSAARLKDIQDLASVDGSTKAATNVTIDDSAGNLTATNVEGALAELFSSPIYDSRYTKQPTTGSDPGVAFDTWRTPSASRTTFVIVDCRVITDGNTDGRVTFDIDYSGSGALNALFNIAYVEAAMGDLSTDHGVISVSVPPGGSYKINNRSDPYSANTISNHIELSL